MPILNLKMLDHLLMLNSQNVGFRKMLKKKKHRRCIGRINYVHPASGELYFLCMFLNVVKGPRIYKEIKTVDGILYLTFQEACNALGLLDNDRVARCIRTSISIGNSASDEAIIHNNHHFCEVSDAMSL